MFYVMPQRWLCQRTCCGGGDRVKKFEKLVNKYNGSTYQFDNIEVVNAGDRDPDGEGVSMSASKMRKAAKDNISAHSRKIYEARCNETAVAYSLNSGCYGYKAQRACSQKTEVLLD